MDGGSFVFETEGYRWAVDLGMENYTKIEATGLRLWDSTQGADRWKVFRLSPESHNILRIDNRQQNVKGKSRIVKFSENSTEMDLTPLYTPVVKKATRTATLLPGRALEIRDRLTGLPPGAEVTWQDVYLRRAGNPSGRDAAAAPRQTGAAGGQELSRRLAGRAGSGIAPTV